MRYLVEYAYGYLPDVKENSVIVEAKLSDDPTYEEENRVFKSLILEKTGHPGVKIMSYKGLD